MKISPFFTRIVVGCLGATLFLTSCEKEQDTSNSNTTPVFAVVPNIVSPKLPTTPYFYANLLLSNYFNLANVLRQVNTPTTNLITDNGATLGRVLFYDKNLSANNTISCASCHKQTNSFSDPAKLSTGFAGAKTTRNSMSLLNARYYPNGHFFGMNGRQLPKHKHLALLSILSKWV